MNFIVSIIKYYQNLWRLRTADNWREFVGLEKEQFIERLRTDTYFAKAKHLLEEKFITKFKKYNDFDYTLDEHLKTLAAVYVGSTFREVIDRIIEHVRNLLCPLQLHLFEP